MQPTNRFTVSALLRRRRFRSFHSGRRCGLRLIATVTRQGRELGATGLGQLPLRLARAEAKARLRRGCAFALSWARVLFCGAAVFGVGACNQALQVTMGAVV